MLITSRNPAWSGMARPVATAVWKPEQGADFLMHHLPLNVSSHDHAALRDLAEALGGLPLALEQAAGFVDETGIAAADYTAQVRDYDSAPLVLDEGRAATGYERSVLATLSIAFPRLGEDAAQLLRLLAFCAPELTRERMNTFAQMRAVFDDSTPHPLSPHDLMTAHAFIAMSFGAMPGVNGQLIDFNRIYVELLKPALEVIGCEVFRADDEQRAGDIRTDIFKELLVADLVLADITLDNPNV